jgi:hypothetical protein
VPNEAWARDFLAKHKRTPDWAQLELDKFRDHEFADPHEDWDAAWRNWLRRAIKPLREASLFPPRSTGEALNPRATREVVMCPCCGAFDFAVSHQCQVTAAKGSQ